jgi:hypothetical protein
VFDRCCPLQVLHKLGYKSPAEFVLYIASQLSPGQRQAFTRDMIKLCIEKGNMPELARFVQVGPDCSVAHALGAAPLP